ncbi:MAG: pectin acetylesterase-family hydrolase, partial [Bacteroidota bacterium]
MPRLASLLLLVASALAFSACDSDDPADSALAEAEANLGAWTWIDVEGSVCRDGSATGIGVRLQDGADDLVIYLEGGGACFNGVTCATNPSRQTEPSTSIQVQAPRLASASARALSAGSSESQAENARAL